MAVKIHIESYPDGRFTHFYNLDENTKEQEIEKIILEMELLLHHFKDLLLESRSEEDENDN